MGEQELKQRITSELENFINLAKEDWVNSFQKELQDAQWHLGEERSRREQLEQALKACQQRCQELEMYLNQTRAWGEQLQKELSDTQWFLGEERARRQHLESQIKT